MREINECTAEVFRRSEKRIKARKKARRRVLAFCIPLCLILTVWAVTALPSTTPVVNDNGGLTDGLPDCSTGNSVGGIHGTLGAVGFGSFDSFSFSLTWGCYGISSYDSVSGRLIKTTDATTPEDYVTIYPLTTAEKRQIYNLISSLNVMSYPDSYNPHKDGLASDPPMTLILSVKTDALEKTIKAEDIALTFDSADTEGQRFLSACKAICDILTQTEEWKELPEYEFFYN